MACLQNVVVCLLCLAHAGPRARAGHAHTLRYAPENITHGVGSDGLCANTAAATPTTQECMAP